jgi:hypothetical protein
LRRTNRRGRRYCSRTSRPSLYSNRRSPRQERKAEQVVAQRPIGKDDAGDVTHDEIADVDLIEARGRGAHAAIRRPDFNGESRCAGWMPSRAALLTVSAITDAPVSTMKLIRRPSTRASTRKCRRARRAARLSRASP